MLKEEGDENTLQAYYFKMETSGWQGGTTTFS